LIKTIASEVRDAAVNDEKKVDKKVFHIYLTHLVALDDFICCDKYEQLLGEIEPRLLKLIEVDEPDQPAMQSEMWKNAQENCTSIKQELKYNYTKSDLDATYADSEW